MAATFDKPDPQVAVRQETKKSLIWIGVLALVVGIALVVLSWAVGNETREDPGGTSSDAKTTTTKSGPSEGVIVAVLGTGAALIVVGFLFGRISSIKLPGGVEVSMTKEAEEKTIKKAVEEHPSDPAKAATVAHVAQKLLLARNAVGAVMTDNDIGTAVSDASKAVS